MRLTVKLINYTDEMDRIIALLTEEGDGPRVYVEKVSYLFPRIASNPSSICLGAYVNEELVGFAIGGPLELFDMYDGVKQDCDLDRRNSIYAEDVSVMPSYRRHGILSRLFTEGIIIARGMGYEKLKVHARISTGVRDFLEGKGGILLQHFDNWWNDEPFDYMELSIANVS